MINSEALRGKLDIIVFLKLFHSLGNVCFFWENRVQSQKENSKEKSTMKIVKKSQRKSHWKAKKFLDWKWTNAKAKHILFSKLKMRESKRERESKSKFIFFAKKNRKFICFWYLIVFAGKSSDLRYAFHCFSFDFCFFFFI